MERHRNSDLAHQGGPVSIPIHGCMAYVLSASLWGTTLWICISIIPGDNFLALPIVQLAFNRDIPGNSLRFFFNELMLFYVMDNTLQ